MRAFTCYFAIALCLFLHVPAALAQEDEPESFVAISEIGDFQDGMILASLTDSSLDAIEGAGLCIGCPSINIQIGIAPIVQLNLINQVSFALGRNITQISGASAVNAAGGSVRRP
jgi:hypothetical protein